MSIWGRLVGGAAGFALGGPIGAILGVMAGSAFDKKKQRSFKVENILQAEPVDFLKEFHCLPVVSA